MRAYRPVHPVFNTPETGLGQIIMAIRLCGNISGKPLFYPTMQIRTW
jgi:hypothetical protein